MNDATAIQPDGLILRPLPRPIPFGPGAVASILDDCKPKSIALIDRNGLMTYEQLNKAVIGAAAVFSSLGLQVGDRVAVSLPNHNGLVAAFIAAQKLGLVWVGINQVLAVPEKLAQLNDSGARVLLTDDAIAETIHAATEPPPELEHIVVASDDGSAWQTMLASSTGLPIEFPVIDPQAPAVISYTSGTTGTPKGAVHSQHSIMTFVNSGLSSGRGGSWSPQLRRSVTIPLTILNGMTFGPLVALAGGGSFVSMDRIDAAGVAEWIERAAIEVLLCTPTTIRDILLKPELQGHNLASLKFVAAGGASGSAELRDIFRERVGSEIVEEYGLTEAPSAVAGSRADERPHTGSVGRAYPHVEVAALGTAGLPLPAGETGELCVRARSNGRWHGVFTGMLGYWKQPEQTRLALRGEWLCTGDMGNVDSAGNIRIVGRQKEMIIRGGANIYPAETELALRSLAEIEDAVVIGLPDERLGQTVAVFIKVKSEVVVDDALASRLQNGCRQLIARYKVPERWFVVGDIPRNAMNKPVRSELTTMREWEIFPDKSVVER